MKTIYLLTDYKGHFGSKHNDFPYRSGMNKELLTKYFKKYNFKTEYIKFSDVDFRKINFCNKYVLYTSSEDIGYYYKSYIEDIVYGLKVAGAKVIPDFKYLRANNNKVFMEILRDQLESEEIRNIRSFHFGALEEAMENSDNFHYPVVVKGAEGAMSKNVTLAKNKKSLHKILKKMSRTKNYKEELREIVRKYKYKGYKKESKYRKKFIIQEFIPGLQNDWKILIYGDKYFIFRRLVRENDFRASGSGQKDYHYGSNCKFPDSIFSFAEKIYQLLKVPHLSIDICYKNNIFYLIEFQIIYFGTVGHEKSDIYYYKKNKNYVQKQNNLCLEEEYVNSILKFVNK